MGEVERRGDRIKKDRTKERKRRKGRKGKEKKLHYLKLFYMA